MLAEFTYRWDELAGHSDFRECGRCDGDVCQARTYRIPPLGFRDWPACPRQLLSDPAWLAASAEYQASLVSPLTGWPDAYTAWAVDALTALRTEGEAHKARVLEERARAAQGGGGPNKLPPLSENHRALRAAPGPRPARS